MNAPCALGLLELLVELCDGRLDVQNIYNLFKLSISNPRHVFEFNISNDPYIDSSLDDGSS